MATVHARLGCLPPPPPPRLPRRRATFSAGPRRSAAARSRVTSLRRASRLGPWTAQALSGAEPSAGVDDASEIIDAVEVEPSSNAGASLLAKVAVALGVAATVTAISIFMKQPSSGPSFSLPQIIDASAQSDTVGYTFSQFGKKVIIPEYTPGWVYFWLLMAAGFGLFVSEEALNVWVGISLARTLCLDGTWQSLVNSFSTNASYIISTVLWVYWGVCISDMVPFYLGKLFRQTRASEDIYSKLGISKDKALTVSRAIQKYGNLIGFGRISRLLFRWSLLRLSVYSSYPVSDWISSQRTPRRGARERCSCRGHLDCVPLRGSGVHGFVPLPPATQAQQLTAVIPSAKVHGACHPQSRSIPQWDSKIHACKFLEAFKSIMLMDSNIIPQRRNYCKQNLKI
uniref:Uncharacterized protein n=1 Tax=Triticum urartu TaxID=4572 RepID=A0A8R7QRM4_TRIUA